MKITITDDDGTVLEHLTPADGLPADADIQRSAADAAAWGEIAAQRRFRSHVMQSIEAEVSRAVRVIAQAGAKATTTTAARPPAHLPQRGRR